jgi:hypothetical protein
MLQQIVVLRLHTIELLHQIRVRVLERFLGGQICFLGLSELAQLVPESDHLLNTFISLCFQIIDATYQFFEG